MGSPANIITGVRILLSLALLPVKVFSPAFYVFYLAAGLSDIIDGPVARKTNTESEAGQRLDSLADIIFVAACIVKLFPALEISWWLLVWTGAIATLKIFNIIMGRISNRQFTMPHTKINKVTGLILFVLPLTLSIISLNCSGAAVCVLASIAAIHELITIRGAHEYSE
ncbi:MAG: CDP-alcohol phosphatidyltransferase family protein [Clostridia bacterium]|nr:CDP-alcohol phosphatidyltransferase family protein [Clostridia bacterium]